MAGPNRIPITHRRAVQIGVGACVSAGCLVAALWGVDFEQVKSSFAFADYSTLPLFLLLLAFSYYIKAVRWRLLLQPLRRMKTNDVVPALMIGFMGNNLLPAHLGELISVFLLSRQFELSRTAVFASVVLERLLDVFSILLLFGLGLFSAAGLAAWLPAPGLFISVMALLTAIALVAYYQWTGALIRLGEWGVRRLPVIPDQFRSHLSRMLQSGESGMSSLRDGRLAVWIIVLSLFQWVLDGCMVLVCLRSFGIQLSLLACFIVCGVTALGLAAPSSPGFFGVYQFCFWISLRPFGVGQAEAFAASVYFQMAQYVPVTLIGLYYLNRLDLKLHDIEEQASDGNRT